jgi:hypothetical protein
MKATYPEFPLYCPIKPGKIYGNTTYRDDDFLKRTPSFLVPNGLHRTLMYIGNKKHPKGFFVQWEVEYNIRLAEDRF